MLSHLEGLSELSERTKNALSFVGGLPPSRVTGIGWSFVLQLRLLFIVVAFERQVRGTFHRFLQQDVRLDSKQDITHPSDVMI